MNSICLGRRNFIARCGLTVVGGLLLPSFVTSFPLQAGTPATRMLSGADAALLKLLSAYGSDSYLWGGGVFSRAAGLAQTSGTIQVLVLVTDYKKLYAFLRSPGLKQLGTIRASGNTLSFTYGGTAYAVTNAGAGDFYRMVAKASGTATGNVTTLSAFAHENLLYHPATDAVLDPYLSLKTRRIDLVGKPSGDLQAQFQTVVDGWMAAKHDDLPFGKSFKKFQSDLLAEETTPAAARLVARAWMQNITSLASVYDVASLRTLLLSPLVASSLESVFHLDAEAAVDRMEDLRATLATDTYPDASIWLAVLLSPEIKDGTAAQWIDETDASSKTAFRAAGQLVAAGQD